MTLDQLVDIVAMPLLLQDEVLRPVDVGVYTNLRHRGATTSYALARRVRLSREALRQSLLRLKQSGWVIESSSTPYGGVVVHAWMPVEVERQLADELERVSRDVKYLGECLLRWALDLLIEDREYQDNVRPTWLVSGTGSQAFEVDRMLPRHRVAIEFQGRYHHLGQAMTPEEESRVQEQIDRDNIKAGLLSKAGVRLVEFSGRDLSFERIVEKLDGVVPVQTNFLDTLRQRPLVRKLSEMMQSYRNYVGKEVRRRRTGVTVLS